MALVVFTLATIYTANGRAINSVDTSVIQHTALSIAARGSADLSPYEELVVSGVDMGYIAIVDGRALSSYPLLPALIAAPAYAAAVATELINPWRPDRARVEAIGAAVATLLVAFACGALLLVVSRWVPLPGAIAVAVACGLATPLWSSASQALWSHAPAALLVSLGLNFGLPAHGETRKRDLWMAGTALTLAVFCRLLLVVLPFGMAWALLRSNGPRRHLMFFAAGAVTAVMVMVVANVMLLGSPLGGLIQLYSTGLSVETHGVAGAWSGSWWSGLAGIFFSPSRGMLLYMPVVLLAIAGVPAAWSDARLRYGVVLPTAAFIAVWAKYAVWWGGHSFGPRLAADISIPLGVIAAYGFSTGAAWRAPGRSFRAAAAAALVVWSIGVQLIGAFYYPAGEWNGGPADVDRAHDRLWDWRDSQLVRTVTSGTYREYRARQQHRSPTDGQDADVVLAEADED